MEKLEAKGLHYLITIVNDWREKYHVNREGDIVFQNKRTMANVTFSDNALHKIAQHSKGFDLIPQTIEKPDEIWSYWENPKVQRVVLRNYITFGQYPFIVQTRDGVIIDAFITSPKAGNKYRKGCIL